MRAPWTKCIYFANHLIILIQKGNRIESKIQGISVFDTELEVFELPEAAFIDYECLLAELPQKIRAQDTNLLDCSLIFEKSESSTQEEPFKLAVERLHQQNRDISDTLISFFADEPSSYPVPIRLAAQAHAAQFGGLSYAVDRAHICNKRVVISGWIENAKNYDIIVFSEDFTLCIPSEDFFFSNRQDVSRLLDDQNRPRTTGEHGFTAVSSHEFRSKPQSFRLFVNHESALLHVGDFSTTEVSDQKELVSLLWQANSVGSIPELDLIRKVIRPLLVPDDTQASYQLYDIYDKHENPLISVIVPFYKEWFFIRTISLMQEIFPEYVEWVLVCDDPITAIEVSRHIASRTDKICRNTRLVINSDNYGYSISNNIGVECSTAETILLMNSDIWIDEPSVVLEALGYIKRNLYQMVGFRLRFEDGSLQHDGISFRRSSQFRRLFLAEHTAKGLPPNGNSELFSPTAAVTGALMMFDKKAFLSVGGFDNEYIKGDFEDADLCLTFTANAMRIAIARGLSCYHLERQSIRRMADSSYREAVTFSNCVYFNDKWSDRLVTLENAR